MWNFISNLISPQQYIPHGHCYLWQTPLVWLHIVSDLLIALAYYSIPLMLLYFVIKRSDVPFSNVFVMFGAFIILCGTGHLLEIWTLWHPAYWLSGAEKAITALVSVYTATEMASLVPQFLSLKTPEQLEIVNRELQKEIAIRQQTEDKLRQANQDLEKRVRERTGALNQANGRELAISRIVRQMRQTLDLKTIFADTTAELRQTIKCDRVVVYQFNPDWSGQVVAESVAEGWSWIVEPQSPNSDRISFSEFTVEDPNCPIKLIQDTYLQENHGAFEPQKNGYRVVNDIEQAGFNDCYLELLAHIQAKAYIVVPIFQNHHLWGLMFAYQNTAPRQWETAAIQIMVQVGTQLGVAVQQAELFWQTQQQAQALKSAKNEADKANRAKSEFLANMSHELRTPLNVIMGYAQLMQRSPNLSEEDRNYINSIDRSGEHLLSLINDVLEMSKIEAGRMTLYENKFDIYLLLAGIQDLLGLKANLRHLKLFFNRDINVPQYIKADSKKLRQVLINLLGNAIKFTETGQVTLDVWVESEIMHFAIKDTGVGIAPEAIDRLFTAFGQADAGLQDNESTGLGLCISRELVELMGGKITVSSVLGQGSIFTFTIPFIPVLESEIEKAPASMPIPTAIAPDQPEYRILVVEDKFANRMLLVKILTSVGFTVKEASNGREAIEIWSSWNPHLIWMDMQMPVMNGYEATKHIKASLQGQSTIIIALTASVFEEQRQEIISSGCDDFMRKPFRQHEIFSIIGERLGVKYVFADNRQLIVNRRDILPVEEFVLDVNSLQIMPPEWIDEVRQRACEGNDVPLLALIEQIPSEYTQIIAALKRLINDFKFAEIIDLARNSSD